MYSPRALTILLTIFSILQVTTSVAIPNPKDSKKNQLKANNDKPTTPTSTTLGSVVISSTTALATPSAASTPAPASTPNSTPALPTTSSAPPNPIPTASPAPNTPPPQDQLAAIPPPSSPQTPSSNTTTPTTLTILTSTNINSLPTPNSILPNPIVFDPSNSWNNITQRGNRKDCGSSPFQQPCYHGGAVGSIKVAWGVLLACAFGGAGVLF